MYWARYVIMDQALRGGGMRSTDCPSSCPSFCKSIPDLQLLWLPKGGLNGQPSLDQITFLSHAAAKAGDLYRV